MVITKTHNINANNALELWHEAPYSINHKAMTDELKDLTCLTLLGSDRLKATKVNN